MFYIKSNQSMPILATYDPNGSIKITASAINQDLGNSFSKYIVEQKDPRFVYAIARAVTADVPNKNWDFFPLDEIQRAYPSFIGRNIFLDHNTTSVRNAVGKIIAAELREDEEGHTYVACLFKVDRQIHPDIAMKIENGIIDSVSMGANVMQAECSICHHRATREAEFCEHLHNLGRYQDFEHGTQNYSINHGVEFTELSLVSVPADPTAKMHKVFDAHSDLKKQADDASADTNADVAQPAQADDPNTVYSVDIPEVMKTGRPDADVPANKSQLIEPVNKDTGFFQIDAASVEAADLLYNILDAYTNKGIEELFLQGRTIKMLFSPDVKDPYKFIADCVAVFGMELGHGVVIPEKIQASYKSYLTVAAKDKSLNNYPLMSEFTSPYLGRVSVRMRNPRKEQSTEAQLIFSIEKDQCDLEAVSRFLTSYTNSAREAKQIPPMEPDKAVSFDVRVNLPAQVEGATAAQYRNTKKLFVEELVKQIAPKMQDITSIQTANDTVSKNEQVMLSDKDKAWIESTAWNSVRKNSKMTDDIAKHLCNLVYNRFSDESKGGNPQKCMQALLYLNSVPELLDSAQHDLVLDFYKEKTKEAVAKPKEHDNKPIDQLQEAVDEVKVGLPKEQAEEAIEEVKEQTQNPVVEEVIEQAETGSVSTSMDKIIEEYGQAEASEIAEAATEAAQELKQRADAEPVEEEEPAEQPAAEEPAKEQPAEEQPAEQEQKQEQDEPYFDHTALTPQEINLIKHYVSDPKKRDNSLAAKNSAILPLFTLMRKRGYKPGEVNTDELFNKLFPQNLPYRISIKSAYTKWYFAENKNEADKQQEEAKPEEQKAYSHKLLQELADWVKAYNSDPNGGTPSAIDAGKTFGGMASSHFATPEAFRSFVDNNVADIKAILGDVPDGYVAQFTDIAKDSFKPAPKQEEQPQEQEQPAEQTTVDQAAANASNPSSGRGFVKEPPEGAKTEENDQDKGEASRYLDSLGSFVYGKWTFTLKEANDMKLKPELIYVRRVRRIRKQRGDKATVELPTPEKVADNQNYEIGYVPKLMYPAISRNDVRKIYRMVPAMMAIMLNTPIEGDVSVTYHVDCKDPIYVGIEEAERGKQFDITFSRTPSEQGNYTYSVSGLDKDISGKANSFKECMAGILNAMYQDRSVGYAVQDSDPGNAVSFKVSPLKYDEKTLLSVKDSMLPITGSVTLILTFEGKSSEKPIAEYTIEKLLPGQHSENMKTAVYTSAFIHLIAAEETEDDKPTEPAEEQEQQEQEQAPVQEEEKKEVPPEEQFKEVEPEEGSKQYTNTERNPQYVFNLKPATSGEIDGLSYVNTVNKVIAYDDIEDFLTAPNGDSFKGILVEWEAEIRKYAYLKLYEYATKHKESAKQEQPKAEQPAAATPSASRGFVFYVRG